MTQTIVDNHLPVKSDELRQIPAFAGMPAIHLDHLAEKLVRQNFLPGQVIFIEGDPSRSLWFVFQGRVRIIKQSENGRIQGLCLMNRGKCFGSCPMFDMAKNPASAQALDPVTLFVLPEEVVQRMRQEDPPLVKILLQIYSERLAHLARISEVLALWTVGDRINDCLLTYANRSTQPPAVEITHEKLAELSGTVREVVTRHLSQLEHEGIVSNATGHIMLLNPEALLPPCASREAAH